MNDENNVLDALSDSDLIDELFNRDYNWDLLLGTSQAPGIFIPTKSLGEVSTATLRAALDAAGITYNVIK
mgnify:CR=1 FL=1